LISFGRDHPRRGPPASIDMLHTVMRSSIDSGADGGSPVYSIT